MSSLGINKTIHKLLYIGMKYDYGIPARGECYEYLNLFGTLEKMPEIHATHFPYDKILREVGKTAMNQRLRETVRNEKPDICFFVLFTDEFEKETIRSITDHSGATTLSWFADDHWRFETFSKFWAPFFHWNITTDASSVERYRQIGCPNVILSQWGFNHHLPAPASDGYRYDVTFVGQVHSSRRRIVQQLAEQNISVNCWGKGWENGRIGTADMAKIFAESRINLNFTASSNTFTVKRFAKIIFSRRCDSTFHLNSPRRAADEIQTLFQHRRPQIKGRNFEIPGHGGFLLTGYAEHLEDYYAPEKDIAVFRTPQELAEKIAFYLSHHEERERIRESGHRRTRKEHTYEKRLQKIFQTVFSNSEDKAGQ